MKITLAAALSAGVVLSGPCAASELPSSPPALIRNLQGCFRVSYRFVEDGRHDYGIKDFLEWITLKQESGAYLIQHYGLLDGEVSVHFNESWSLLGLAAGCGSIALHVHFGGPNRAVTLLLARRAKTRSRPKTERLRSAQPCLHDSDHAEGLGSKRNERQSHESRHRRCHRSRVGRIPPRGR
jgi:hypothetical protein